MDGTVGMENRALLIFGLEGRTGTGKFFGKDGMVGRPSKNQEGYPTLVFVDGGSILPLSRNSLSMVIINR